MVKAMAKSVFSTDIIDKKISVALDQRDILNAGLPNFS